MQNRLRYSNEVQTLTQILATAPAVKKFHSEIKQQMLEIPTEDEIAQKTQTKVIGRNFRHKIHCLKNVVALHKSLFL